MKNALILHGTDFARDKKQHSTNWFPWLKQKLEKRGYKVFLPELPLAYKPNLKRYFRFLKANFQFNNQTVVVGHSSGAAVIPGILQFIPDKIDKAFLVAPFYKDEGWNCEGLFSFKPNWKKIRKQANKIIIIHSQDDPYVKPQQAYYLQKKLDCPLIMKKQQGHFNLEKGEQYQKFPLLLKLLDE